MYLPAKSEDVKPHDLITKVTLTPEFKNFVKIGEELLHLPETRVDQGRKMSIEMGKAAA